MDDREFFELIYQQWSKTTGAEDTYWMPEEASVPSICETDTGLWDFNLYAVDEAQDRELIATGLSEADADFISGVHGCFGDLIRRLVDSLDEADRLDEEKDELIVRIADLEQEAILNFKELERQEEQITKLDGEATDLLVKNAELLDEIHGLENELSIAYAAEDHR